MSNQLNSCPSLLQTNSSNFKEHLNTINNKILPAKPLRHTNSISVKEHVSRLNKKYNNQELYESSDEEDDEEEYEIVSWVMNLIGFNK